MKNIGCNPIKNKMLFSVCLIGGSEGKYREKSLRS
jgi:hypothetical protein